MRPPAAGDAVQATPNPRVGLCSVCAHMRVVENRRGSSFYLCGRSRLDPSFRRYPGLPVLACRGFERHSDEADVAPEDREPNRAKERT